ncbi:MAG: S8 family serine peptidase [Fimbriimonadales bacterium]|nr:S8 family serine peptidase [Fimbriimonadales bacterium]
MALNAVGGQVQSEIPSIGVKIVRLPAHANEQAALNTIKNRPGVEFAELDKAIASSQVTPNDPWYVNQPQLNRINAPLAWSYTTGSPDVIIAILDSGVSATHEDLAANIVPGWNTFSNNSDTSDVAGHGTAVAGVAAAAGNNGKGIASVAWNCKIMPMRITDAQGYGYYSTAASALTWSSDRGARVANISFEMSDSSTVRSAAQYFMSRGGVVTSSAGNQGAYRSYPDNPYILTVGALDANNVIYSWSNYGPAIDIAAPGDARSTTRAGGYGVVSGTSISSPTVAGIAALVISANPSLTGDQVAQILKDSADDAGAPGWDMYYGHGRANALTAVQMAVQGGGGGGGSPDVEAPQVTILEPSNGQQVSGQFSVKIGATDNVGIESVTLYVNGVSQGTMFSAPYTWTLNASNWSEGQHSIRAEAKDYSSNSASAEIVVQRVAADTQAPTVTILSPLEGSTIGNTTLVTVDARDNVGVTKVELYVNNKRVATSTAAPFSMTWNSRTAKKGWHTLRVLAFDAAGNSAWSATVNVRK